MIPAIVAANADRNAALSAGTIVNLSSAGKDARNGVMIDRSSKDANAASSGATTDNSNSVKTAALSVATIVSLNKDRIAEPIGALNGERKIGARIARSVAIPMIAVTHKRGGIFAHVSTIAITITATGPAIGTIITGITTIGIIATAIIITGTIGIIAITAISTGIIAVTIMAIIIAIIIVGTISGTIRRVRSTGVATVHSIIIRGQPSASSMTVAISLA
ncbi:MAG: hypothetical protein AAF961_07875, partial [Planctomycetota bacterium]